MNRLVRYGVAVALVSLAIGFIASAEAGTRVHSSASVLSTIKKYAKKYAKQYAKRGPQGPQGRQGPQGPEGPQGPQGPTGVLSFTTVDSPHEDLPPGGNTSENFDANCPAGSTVVGSGFYSSVASVGFVKSYTFFVGGFIYNDTGITVRDVHVQAMCIKFAAGTPGSAKANVSRANDQFRSDRASALTK